MFIHLCHLAGTFLLTKIHIQPVFQLPNPLNTHFMPYNENSWRQVHHFCQDKGRKPGEGHHGKKKWLQATPGTHLELQGHCKGTLHGGSEEWLCSVSSQSHTPCRC